MSKSIKRSFLREAEKKRQMRKQTDEEQKEECGNRYLVKLNSSTAGFVTVLVEFSILSFVINHLKWKVH